MVKKKEISLVRTITTQTDVGYTNNAVFSSHSVDGVDAFELKIWPYITELHLQTGGALNKKSDRGNKALIREIKTKKVKSAF